MRAKLERILTELEAVESERRWRLAGVQNIVDRAERLRVEHGSFTNSGDYAAARSLSELRGLELQRADLAVRIAELDAKRSRLLDERVALECTPSYTVEAVA